MQYYASFHRQCCCSWCPLCRTGLKAPNSRQAVRLGSLDSMPHATLVSSGSRTTVHRWEFCHLMSTEPDRTQNKRHEIIQSTFAYLTTRIMHIVYLLPSMLECESASAPSRAGFQSVALFLYFLVVVACISSAWRWPNCC